MFWSIRRIIQKTWKTKQQKADLLRTLSREGLGSSVWTSYLFLEQTTNLDSQKHFLFPWQLPSCSAVHFDLFWQKSHLTHISTPQWLISDCKKTLIFNNYSTVYSNTLVLFYSHRFLPCLSCSCMVFWKCIDVLSSCDLGHRLAAMPPRSDINLCLS